MFKNLFKKKEKKNFTFSEDYNDFQLKVLNSYRDGKDIFEMVPRRAGKTFIGTRISIFHALSKPNSKVLILAPTHQISTYVRFSVRDILAEKDMQAYKMNINFDNDSILDFKSVTNINEDQYRGSKFSPYDLIYYDEFLMNDSKDLNIVIAYMSQYNLIDKNTIHIGLGTYPVTESIKILKSE